MEIQQKNDFPTWKIGLNNGFSHPKINEKHGFFHGSGYQIHEKSPEIAEKSGIFGDNFHYFCCIFTWFARIKKTRADLETLLMANIGN